jgi:uncharacterized protein (TIRG00374 family)
VTVRRLAPLLRLLVAVGITGVIFWRSDPRAVARAAAQADLPWLVLAVLTAALDRTLMAVRWVLLLAPVAAETRPPLRTLLRIFFVSSFVGAFLPASIGGDAARAYSLARHAVPGANAVASVAMDRALGTLSIFIMGTAGLLIIHTQIGDALLLAVFAATLAAAALIGAVVFSETAGRWAAAGLARLPWERLRRVSQALVDAIRAYAAHHRLLGGVLAASVAVQVLRILEAWLLGLALGLSLPLSIYFAFVPIILLVIVMPVTVAGLGTTQLAFVWLFGQVGVPGAVAFTMSVLYLALGGLIGNLPGGLLLALGPPRSRAR